MLSRFSVRFLPSALCTLSNRLVSSKMPSWVVVGLSGVTNSGKTTLSKAIINQYPGTLAVFQDNYFFPIDSPSHIPCENVQHHNWDVMSALDMDKMVQDVHKIFDREPTENESGILILDGFLLLSHRHLSSLCSLKVYIDLDYEEVKRRRSTRNYEPPDPPGYFEKVVWPESRKAKEDILKHNKDVLILNGRDPVHTKLSIVSKKIDHLLSLRTS